MGEFVNENIGIILGGLLGMINFLFWNRIRRIEKDIEANKTLCGMIEHNYLDRFEKLNEKLNEVEKNIIKEIYASAPPRQPSPLSMKEK